MNTDSLAPVQEKSRANALDFVDSLRHRTKVRCLFICVYLLPHQYVRKLIVDLKPVL